MAKIELLRTDFCPIPHANRVTPLDQPDAGAVAGKSVNQLQPASSGSRPGSRGPSPGTGRTRDSTPPASKGAGQATTSAKKKAPAPKPPVPAAAATPAAVTAAPAATAATTTTKEDEIVKAEHVNAKARLYFLDAWLGVPGQFSILHWTVFRA